MSKKIATITFHWANNYGAVLQAYALQQHLLRQGYDSEIINYIPRRTYFRGLLVALKKRDLNHFKKEKPFKEFRRRELILSRKKYFNNRALFKCANDYYAVITGSDQVWNMSFLNRAEGKPTFSYYLNFAGKNTKKISYATSFGTVSLSEKNRVLIKPQLETFDAISVRENTGVQMLETMGIASERVLDPTLLLAKEDYLKLVEKSTKALNTEVCTYIIHSKQLVAKQVSAFVRKTRGINQKEGEINNESIYDWLKSFAEAKVVVTNSFHGTVFSLIFHKPFITVAVPGSGMNDRLTTLLESLGLADRFVNEYNEKEISDILNTEIDWDAVDKNLEETRKHSQDFLTKAIEQ